MLNSRRGHEVGKLKEGLLFLSSNLFSHIYIYICKVRLLCPLIYSFIRTLGRHIVPISSTLIGGGWSYKQWLKTSKLWLVNLSKLDAALTVSTVHACCCCCCCCWSFLPSLSSFTHHKNNCMTASWLWSWTYYDLIRTLVHCVCSLLYPSAERKAWNTSTNQNAVSPYPYFSSDHLLDSDTQVRSQHPQVSYLYL